MVWIRVAECTHDINYQVTYVYEYLVAIGLANGEEENCNEICKSKNVHNRGNQVKSLARIRRVWRTTTWALFSKETRDTQ